MANYNNPRVLAIINEIVHNVGVPRLELTQDRAPEIDRKILELALSERTFSRIQREVNAVVGLTEEFLVKADNSDLDDMINRLSSEVDN